MFCGYIYISFGFRASNCRLDKKVEVYNFLKTYVCDTYAGINCAVTISQRFFINIKNSHKGIQNSKFSRKRGKLSYLTFGVLHLSLNSPILQLTYTKEDQLENIKLISKEIIQTISEILNCNCKVKKNFKINTHFDINAE